MKHKLARIYLFGSIVQVCNLAWIYIVVCQIGSLLNSISIEHSLFNLVILNVYSKLILYKYSCISLVIVWLYLNINIYQNLKKTSLLSRSCQRLLNRGLVARLTVYSLILLVPVTIVIIASLLRV